LTFGVLLTALHRTKLRGSAIGALSRTPSRTGISHSYSAALPRRCSEYDLAFIRTTYLHRDIIGFALCFFVRTQAVFASLLVVCQGAIPGKGRRGSCEHKQGGRKPGGI